MLGAALAWLHQYGPCRESWLWADPGSCGHSLGSPSHGHSGTAPCREALPPAAPGSFSLTEQPISVTPWQHHVLGCPADTDRRWLPIRLQFYKNSVFFRLSDGIHKAANMLAHCTRRSTAFHWVQQFPEAPSSVCFKEQDIAYQPCKNTLRVKEIAIVVTAHLVKDPLCCRGFKSPVVTLFAFHHLFFIFCFPERHLPQMGENDLDSVSPPKDTASHIRTKLGTLFRVAFAVFPFVMWWKICGLLAPRRRRNQLMSWVDHFFRSLLQKLSDFHQACMLPR